jgi:hypothetical protein
MMNAREMARACDQYVSALWRGESEEVLRFSRWLRGHWVIGPEEPGQPPTAFSVVGASGAGIRWHDVGPMIYGYIPGVPVRCYQIPSDSDPPPIAFARPTPPVQAISPPPLA